MSAEPRRPPATLPPPEAYAARIQLVAFDFDGVFTDNAVLCDGNGGEWVRCWRGDGLGLGRLRDLGLAVWVLSTEKNPVVGARCEKLGVPVRQGLEHKGLELRRLAAQLDVPLGDVVYVGNDINDRDCLEIAGLPIVVRDAHPDVWPLARYRTRRAGGRGAVREICDWIGSSMVAQRAHGELESP